MLSECSRACPLASTKTPVRAGQEMSSKFSNQHMAHVLCVFFLREIDGGGEGGPDRVKENDYLISKFFRRSMYRESLEYHSLIMCVESSFQHKK